MGQKSGSQGDKVRYTRYKAESRYEKNTKAKVARHIKNNPNDEVAQKRLKEGFKYSRKAPNSRTIFYSRAWKKFAQQLRKYTGSGKAVEVYSKLQRAVYD